MIEVFNLWWVWVIVGFALFGIEVLASGGFFIFFFGFGALLTGLLAASIASVSFGQQMLFFAASSLILLLLFRKQLVSWLNPKAQMDQDSLVGTFCITSEEIAVGSLGKVEARGASWNAKNISESVVPVGARCEVVEVSGLTLMIKPS